MPASTLDHMDALHEIAEVENALFDGYQAEVISGSKKRVALSIAAERLGENPQSMRRRIGRPGAPGNHLKNFELQVDWSMYRPAAVNRPGINPVEETKLGGSEKDRIIIGLKDEVSRLTKELKNAHREANVEEILKDILGGIAGAAPEMPAWLTSPEKVRGRQDPEVPVTSWADWHLGEVVELEETNGVNEYNLDIAGNRIERLIDKTIMLCRDFHTNNYPGVVINLVGDFVSGGLHPELKATDEEEVIPATLHAVDWMHAGLRRMADHFGQVYVPACAGNHGRGTAKPEFKRYYKKNFDWLIYQFLARRLQDDKRIVFDIRPSNDVLYKVYGQRFYLTHGDMLGVKGGDGIIGAIGPIMRGEVKKSGQMSSIGHTFDKIIMGHWHQDLWLPRAIVANTLKGFDEYARLQLGAKPTRPSQPLFFVHQTVGMTAHYNVYVERPRQVVPQPWITIFDETKEVA